MRNQKLIKKGPKAGKISFRPFCMQYFEEAGQRFVHFQINRNILSEMFKHLQSILSRL